MFKLYQATQARMNDGLVETLNNRIKFLGLLVGLQIGILLMSLRIWLWKVKKYNRKFAELFGCLCIYPKEMMKINKTVLQTIKKVLMVEIR